MPVLNACNVVIQEPEARGSSAGDQPRPHSSRAAWDARQATVSQKQNSKVPDKRDISRKYKSAVHGFRESKLKHEHACCGSRRKNDAGSHHPAWLQEAKAKALVRRRWEARTKCLQREASE